MSNTCGTAEGCPCSVVKVCICPGGVQGKSHIQAYNMNGAFNGALKLSNWCEGLTVSYSMLGTDAQEKSGNIEQIYSNKS